MINSLLNGWMFRAFINSMLNSLVGVNLFVAVWGGNTSPIERSSYMIVSEFIAMVAAQFGESVVLRAWIMRNYLKLLWGLVLADCFLWSIYFHSPYMYLIIYTVLFDGVWHLMFMTSGNEIKEVLVSSANRRTSYNARLNKMFSAGSIVGGLLSIVLPICEWGSWAMIAGFVVCGFGCAIMTSQIFYRTRVYMRDNNLDFPCCVVEGSNGGLNSLA